jgi:hypothetical protein
MNLNSDLPQNFAFCFSRPQSWTLAQPEVRMLSVADFRTLTDASERYLTRKDYGVPEVENVMVQIFGTNRIGGEAEAWTKYWRELNIYEEQLQEGVDGAPPKVYFIHTT